MVQGESIATAKGPTDFVCLWEHRLVPAWELTMASGYCLGLGFPYVFFSTCFVEPVSVCFRVSVPVSVPICVRTCLRVLQYRYDTGHDVGMIRV